MATQVSKATISAWVVKLLRRAYSEATDLDARLPAMSEHEIRVLAASLAVQAMLALSVFLKAATRATPSTFISHYLRDGPGIQGQLHVLSPCVVAGRHSLNVTRESLPWT